MCNWCEKRWDGDVYPQCGDKDKLSYEQVEICENTGKNGSDCVEIQLIPESYPQVINILWISGESLWGNVGYLRG